MMYILFLLCHNKITGLEDMKLHGIGRDFD